MVLYRVEVTSFAQREIRELPGNMRQRILRLLKALQEEPRPPMSKQMDITKVGYELESNVALYRIRVESWRVVYVLEEELQLMTVLAIRKRPPYQYDDLRKLIDNAISPHPDN
jgi:mRNA interferase RelE/StbE